jgi:hypothetical protein
MSPPLNGVTSAQENGMADDAEVSGSGSLRRRPKRPCTTASIDTVEDFDPLIALRRFSKLAAPHNGLKRNIQQPNGS